MTLDRAPAEGTPIHKMPDFEREPVNETFAREVAESARNASKGVARVQQMMDEFLRPGAKKPGKAELEAMREELRRAGSYFEGSMTHITRNFKEAIERATEVAKTEVESFVSDVAQRTGLELLRKGGLPELGHVKEDL